jgi:hypothetical protein
MAARVTTVWGAALQVPAILSPVEHETGLGASQPSTERWSTDVIGIQLYTHRLRDGWRPEMPPRSDTSSTFRSSDIEAIIAYAEALRRR